MKLSSLVSAGAAYLRKVCPWQTGNMEQSIKVEKKSRSEYWICIHASDVPYVCYTNEEWTSAKWKGKKNPNENWISDAAVKIAETIAEKLGGTVSGTENFKRADDLPARLHRKADRIRFAKLTEQTERKTKK